MDHLDGEVDLVEVEEVAAVDAGVVGDEEAADRVADNVNLRDGVSVIGCC